MGPPRIGGAEHDVWIGMEERLRRAVFLTDRWEISATASVERTLPKIKGAISGLAQWESLYMSFK